MVVDCHPDVPVYTLKREDGTGRKRRLHENMLFPVEDRLPSDDIANESDVDDADKQSVDELVTPGFEYLVDVFRDLFEYHKDNEISYSYQANAQETLNNMNDECAMEFKALYPSEAGN